MRFEFLPRRRLNSESVAFVSLVHLHGMNVLLSYIISLHYIISYVTLYLEFYKKRLKPVKGLIFDRDSCQYYYCV